MIFTGCIVEDFVDNRFGELLRFLLFIHSQLSKGFLKVSIRFRSNLILESFDVYLRSSIWRFINEICGFGSFAHSTKFDSLQLLFLFYKRDSISISFKEFLVNLSEPYPLPLSYCVACRSARANCACSYR